MTKLFGDNLRQLRKASRLYPGGLSQERLALEAGLNRSYVGAVERGERNISLVNICKLAHTIGCTPAELLNGLEAGTTSVSANSGRGRQSS